MPGENAVAGATRNPDIIGAYMVTETLKIAARDID
jgi:hypothetical protein